ncbi:MAG: 2-amino-4-hydroxy-6-hydroxymethyldihydropteridine diphosphokinase [Candidatus Omnitrophica bacterium]|nr:2-amino-4-hydroxy-6-hydroxymethyldihydropteridine diphosphokinase [Candidatus Omnitrophota bacterium]
MITCYIGIGSNLGDRRRNIDAAIEALKNSEAITFNRRSSIYETEPVDAPLVNGAPQGRFLNGVLEIETALSPGDLLKRLHEIEASLGRKRSARNAPRQIDLDILYYGSMMIDEEGLKIPHPRIGKREFVLQGLRELGKA